jgi:zinc protease
MKRFFLLLAALAVYAVSFAQPIPAGQEFRTGRLGNGLTYYVCHNENPAGCAEFYIAHNVGALQEEDSQNGLAHFLEHMAFNGSKHFEGNSLLKFLAREGVRFGYNVNAYTTRRETVYNISVVPLVRESFVDSVLLILHDWSCDISCEPAALDDERGVISEEYRLRDDSRSHVALIQNNLVYKGSKQAERSVIGSLDVINGFKREEILDFYHKWYRPDLQAIIVVGDFDVDWMVAKIRKQFADIPMPADAPQKEHYFPPHLDQPLFQDVADNMIKFYALKIFCKQPYPGWEERGSESYIKDLYCRNIVSSVLAERLKKAARAKTSPARSAILTTSEYEPDYYISLFTVTPKETSLVAECLEFTQREIRRMLLHGISPAEFEAAKLYTAQRYHLDRPLDREDIKSSEIVTGIIGHFLKNHPLLNPVDLQEIETRVLGEIAYKDILPYPAKMFRDCELIYSTFYNPEDNPGIAPSEEEMKAILERVNAENIGPAYLEYKTPDLSVTAPQGTIRKVTPKKGYEVWSLSNGAKVYYKKAHPVTSNYHLAMQYRWDTGARSYNPDKLTPSRFAAAYLAQNLGFRGLEKPEFKNYPELSGFGFSVSAAKSRAAISITAGKGKEENAFKTAFLTLSEPYFGKQLEKSKENNLKSLARKKRPVVLFEERCDREVYGNHPWMQVIDSAAVEAVDMALVEDVFHRAFGDFKNMSVFICSDLDKSVIEDYVCRYVASLNGDYPYRKSSVKAPAPQVKGTMLIEETHKPESEPLTNIYYAFLRKEKATTRNLVISDFLDYIMSARYNDLIREERGGAYHVGYATAVPDNPSHPWRGIVQFKTRPDMADIVLQDVADVMEQMCKEGPTDVEMEMAGKYILKRHGELEARAERSIGTQLDRLEETVLLGRDYDCDYEKILRSITAKDVQKMARHFAAGDILKEIYTEK